MQDRNGVEIKPGDILRWNVTYWEHLVEVDKDGLYVVQGAPALIPRLDLSSLDLSQYEVIGHEASYDEFLKKRPGQ